jgi:hypothetical protein
MLCLDGKSRTQPTDSKQHRLQRKVDLQGRSPAHPCLHLPASFRRDVPTVARDYLDKEIAPPAPIPSSSAAKPIATQLWPCRGRHQGPLGRFIALFVAFRTPKSHVSVIPKTRTAESSVVICNYTLPKRTRSLFACASQTVRLFFCSFCCSVSVLAALLLLSRLVLDFHSFLHFRHSFAASWQPSKDETTLDETRRRNGLSRRPSLCPPATSTRPPTAISRFSSPTGRAASYRTRSCISLCVLFRVVGPCHFSLPSSRPSRPARSPLLATLRWPSVKVFHAVSTFDHRSPPPRRPV